MIGGELSTPLDFSFRLGPIPVRVNAMFWLISALFGYNCSPDPIWINLPIWVACAFISILIHELGHAMAYRLFGSWASITLQGFGGYALSHNPPVSPWKRLFVSAAGPLAGFAFAGVLYGSFWGLLNAGVAINEYAANAFSFLMFMNIVWGILNLFPILPLDGGRILQESAEILRVPNPNLLAHGVSFTVALLLGIASALRVYNLIPIGVLKALPEWFLYYFRPGLFLTIWFFLLAYDNFQRLQMLLRARRPYYDDGYDRDDETPPWRRR